MEVCFLLFSSYIVPVFCSRSVIMQKRNAIFVRYALAGLSPEFRKFSTCSGVFRKFGVCLTFRALGLTLPCGRNGLRTLRVLCLFAGAVLLRGYLV